MTQSGANHGNHSANEVHHLTLFDSSPDLGQMGIHQRLDGVVSWKSNQRQITEAGPRAR